MIEVSGITLGIGGKAVLQDVSLRCDAGTLTVLVGPNGAGKSTLLSVIAGDAMPGTGDVALNGQPVKRMRIRELAQMRSVFPQGAEIRFGYRVVEVVSMGRAFRDVPPEQDAAAIGKAMEDAEIAHLALRNAQTLSGGEQARTTFARVLVQETPVILLDEPTAALDLRHQERVLRRARDLAAAGATVLAVLHDLNLAAAYADQIVLLRDGSIVASGAPWDVLTEPRITEVYRQPVCILPHPERDCPVILTK
ncbi:iron complex transport system ATP-binding protein [Roseovarius pacificus]|uniref:Iron complex transport system ATP-binding protein n=1 Tax=Roseovarius pacificus TaxID=337701 RepID=A0A1M7A6V8_9RHOB|nr:heme ABC transporter ATP-binding protein [Roseovarius pacificus]GGO53830.1 hemin import ATP-binding protein HmuV [Roseovarius pacificus]SHL38329.1 iron complex transport system ATP-binding protein [Roseovarius pacificus]